MFEISSMTPYWKTLEPWLKKADSVALVQAVRALEANYKAAFKIDSRNFPKIKSKSNSRWSYKTRGESIRVLDDSHINLPKLGR